jgi:hypothetical protein
MVAGLVAVCGILLLTAAVKKGMRSAGSDSMDALAYDYLDVGNFWNKIWNRQYIGDSQSDPKSGTWPGGSGVTYIYAGYVWFGTLKGSDIHVSGDLAVGGNSDPEWHEMGVSETELLASDQQNWNLRPSYCISTGDLDTYAICNDDNAGENGPIPATLEMHGICWSAPGHDDWIVLECWLTNDNSSPLSNDCYVSLAYDIDIGGSLDYIDDLVGYDGNSNADTWNNPTSVGEEWTIAGPDGVPDENDAVNFSSTVATKPLVKGGGDIGWPRMLTYMYDEGGESRDTPGYCGVRVMGWMDDDDKEGSLIEISSQHSWDIMNDPDTDAYKYGYMIDVGTYEEINTAYDWRIDPCFGPFAMEPNQVIHWWTGVVMGGDLFDLRVNADALYADFLGADGLPGTDDDWQVVSPPVSPRLVAVRGDNQVILRWNPDYAPGHNTETEPDPRTNIRDFDGYLVWRSDIGYDSGWETIAWIDKLSKTDPNENPDADYRYYPWGWRVSGQAHNRWNEAIPTGRSSRPNEPNLSNTPAVALENISEGDFPSNTRQGGTIRLRKVGGYYELVDGVDGGGAVTGDVSNGTRYYYAVVGYDFGNFTSFDFPAYGGRNVNAVSVIPLPTSRNVLDDIRVVPNPYKGSADWEEWTGSGSRLGRLYFMNLPSKCTIRIYTIAGDLVRTLEHHDISYGAEAWDLTGEAGVQVASGIYIYHVDAPEFGEKIGKFAVLIGQN